MASSIGRVVEPDEQLVWAYGMNGDSMGEHCVNRRHRAVGDIGYPEPGTDLLAWRGPMAVTEICGHEECQRRAASWVAAITGQKATFARFTETGRGRS